MKLRILALSLAFSASAPIAIAQEKEPEPTEKSEEASKIDSLEEDLMTPGDSEIAEQAQIIVELQERLDRKGNKQRVAQAEMIAEVCTAIFLGEPESELTEGLRRDLLAYLELLQADIEARLERLNRSTAERSSMHVIEGMIRDLETALENVKEARISCLDR